MNLLSEMDSKSETALVFEDVVKIYDDRPVLDGVSFTVRDGEHVSLVGESMSGKTTILKLAAGPGQARVRPGAGVRPGHGRFE